MSLVTWEEELGLERIRRAHAHGLREVLRRLGYPSWVMRVYWLAQPIRCALGFHDWYSTAAGLCSACRCGASANCSPVVAHRWRDPEKRLLASLLEEAEMSRDAAWSVIEDFARSQQETEREKVVWRRPDLGTTRIGGKA